MCGHTRRVCSDAHTCAALAKLMLLRRLRPFVIPSHTSFLSLPSSLPFLPRFLPFCPCSSSLGNGRAAAIVVGCIRVLISESTMIRTLHPHTSLFLTYAVGIDDIENGKAWMRTLEGTVGEVVPLTERHEHVHAARSRTFRLAL